MHLPCLQVPMDCGQAAATLTRVKRWLPAVAVALTVGVFATFLFAHWFGSISPAAVIAADYGAWMQMNWAVGARCGAVAGLVTLGVIWILRRTVGGDLLPTATVAVFAMAIFGILTFWPGGPKACVIDYDLTLSYNGGCEDSSIPVLEMGDRDDMELQTD